MVCPIYQGTEGKQVLCKWEKEALAVLRFNSPAKALAHVNRYCKANHKECAMYKTLTCSER